MYDTLWIGCSHSAGLYNNKNVIISPDNGIANRLAASLQEKWKILAIRGEGMHTYMECIKVLDNNGYLNKFKNIIVQQTSEPRLNFYTSKGYQHMFDNILRYIENDDLAERLILNHLICIFNAFGIEAALNILELKLEDKHWPVIKPFLLFLNYIKNNQYLNIEMDKKVVEKLREI